LALTGAVEFVNQNAKLRILRLRGGDPGFNPCDTRQEGMAVGTCDRIQHNIIVAIASPPMFFVRDRKVVPTADEKRVVDGKLIKEAALKVRVGDWLVFVSDGVINTGIGGVRPLGWGWEQIAGFIERYYHTDRPHQGLEGDTPVPHTQPPEFTGPTRLVTTPVLGGLHHTYRRVAA
jgi:hypothetical protein